MVDSEKAGLLKTMKKTRIEMLSLRIENYTEARVVYLAGNLDAQSCVDLSSLLDGFLLVGISSIILDLSVIEILSSAAQRVIFDAYLRIYTVGNMALCGINQEISQLLMMTGLSKHIAVYPSLDVALDAFTTD
jgi:anti-anti-sigma factor